MANSKGRRKLRRILQEQGLSVPQPAPVTPRTPEPSIPFWKRIPGWLYGAVVALSVLITTLEGYPWLSVQEGPLLDPQNPYSELFSVSNGGYAPVSNLGAYCFLNTTYLLHWTFLH